MPITDGIESALKGEKKKRGKKGSRHGKMREMRVLCTKQQRATQCAPTQANTRSEFGAPVTSCESGGSWDGW